MDESAADENGATRANPPVAGGRPDPLVWHTLCQGRAEPGSIEGVITSEELARWVPRPRIDAVFRDLVAWDIELFASTRDATGG